jgi:nicotinate-nucleotide adenylyltransferase
MKQAMNLAKLKIWNWWKTSQPQRVGIYGGKFDPPHVGHLMCAEMTREAFHLDKVLFVTSANPPHKKTGVSDARVRHEMVEAALFRNCFFEACDIELKRSGPSYTLDTVRALSNQYGPGTELFLMLSSEYLEPTHSWHLSKWHDSAELFRLTHFLIFARPGHTTEQIEEWAKLIPEARIEVLAFCPAPPVSSTMIRDRIGRGESVWYMILPEVWQMIRKRGLYTTGGDKTPRRCTTCQKYGNLVAGLVRSLRNRFSN